MQLDLKTIYFLAAAFSFILLTFALTLNFFRKRFTGYTCWILSLSFHALAFTFIGYRNLLPDYITIHIANSFSIIAAILFLISIMQFRKFKINWFQAIIWTILSVLLFQLSTLTNSIKIRILASALILGNINAVNVYMVLRKTKKPNYKMINLLAIGLFLISLSSYIRIVVTYYSPESTDYLHYSNFQSYYVLIFIGMIVWVNLAYIMAMNEKSERDLERLNKIIINKNKQLYQSNEIKNKLLSIIGHDLKAPISSLIKIIEIKRYKAETSINILEDTFTATILHLLKSVSYLLENILSWARHEQGKIKVDIKKRDLKELIEDIFNLMQPIANDKNIQIKINNPTESCSACFDYFSIHTVMRNLISNAIKYSFENKDIEIKLSNEPSRVLVSVTDFGLGIKKDRLHQILNDDITISEEGTKGEKGTGIGLSLCKELILYNHSKLFATSKNEEETKFYFYLPKTAIN